MQDNSKIVNKIFELYVIQRTKFLIQRNGGEYITARGFFNSSKMEKHLDGKYTMGTFSGGAYTKFITFDVDYEDKELAKWVTYKISNELYKVGIHEHYISFSGNKGYHIDIFISDLIPFSTGRRFYEYILREAEIEGFDGKVEFRPTDKQGVKLPLGLHQVTKKFCGFCDLGKKLKVMTKKQSYNQLFLITRIDRDRILNILEEYIDLPPEKSILKTEEAISKHKELDIYTPSEDDLITKAMELLTDGLKITSSRHNSLMLMARYLKYTGLEKDECINTLNDWMNNQDKKMYKTKLIDCYKDIKSIVADLYMKDLSLTPNVKEAVITLDEINQIITKCPEKNQKLILYAMLKHSKRFASPSGIFYMTFQQIREATSISRATSERQIDKLVEYGVVEIVEKNRKQKGKIERLPRKYRLLLHIDSNINENETYITNDNNNDIFECLKVYYTESELKSILPRKQYKWFTSESPRLHKRFKPNT